MHCFLTEEQELMRNTVREFAQREVRPRVKQLDESGEFPKSLFRKCAELNFLACTIPKKYGGLDLDLIGQCLVLEEIAKEFASLSLIIDAHSVTGCTPIILEGTEEQKKRYLGPAARGEKIHAYCLTEAQAGSDAANIKTTAVLKGDEWEINGSKCWITNHGVADVYLITAKTEPDKGYRGITSFIVEKGTPGFIIGKNQPKMGFTNAPTGELIFENCRIPEKNQLGKLNKGFQLFMRGLDEARVVLGAISLGIAEGAFERAVYYSKHRVQFNKTISSNQGVSFKLADMAMGIEATRLLVYKCGAMSYKGKPFSKEAAMCKAFAAEVARKVCINALQIYGANGYSKDYDIERYVREASGLGVMTGTNEIQKIIISGHILT